MSRLRKPPFNRGEYMNCRCALFAELFAEGTVRPVTPLQHMKHGAYFRILALTLLVVSVIPASRTQAEWYVGGYGGLTNPGALSNVTVSSPTLGGGVQSARVIDLQLQNNGVFGAKVGYFFERHSWFGLEGDFYTLQADVKAQTVVGGMSSGRVFADTLAATPLRLTTGVINVVVRSPSLSECFQPYGGMGYGLFVASSSGGGRSTTHISPGLNLFAGARYVLTEKAALFGEFKFNRSSITFNDIRGGYSSQLFIAGSCGTLRMAPNSLLITNTESP
jgi:opacity protein-like surface antigen